MDLSRAAVKRVKVENEPMNRLLAEIKRLNDLIKPSKTKNEIRDSALKVKSLFDIAHADWCQQHEVQELRRNSQGLNAELCDGSTQTPSSISKLCDADFVLKCKGDPTKHDEILKMEWPKEAYESTHIVKGGLFKTRPGTARVVICSTGKVSTNEQLSRLAQSKPSLKNLNDENLPAGKLAVVRCGEEIVIDGEKSTDSPQYIVVAAVETPAKQPVLLDIMAKIGAQAEKSGSETVIVALPPGTETTLARKALELFIFRSGIKGEILAEKHPRQQGNVHRQRGAGDKTSFTIIPNGGATLADIVKGVQEEVDPARMGITVHSLHETKAGGVQVTYQNNKAMPSAFFEKVQQCVASKATCHLRKGSVIIQGIEAVLSEKEIMNSLAEALDVPPNRLEAGKISTNFRGRSLVVTMSCDLVERALQLKHIQQCWTKAYIREKIDPDFCDYCQAFGHLTRNCKTRIQQPRRCHNCGKVGHLKSSCTKPAACFSCNVEGHRGNSMACPVYRAQVVTKRQK